MFDILWKLHIVTSRLIWRAPSLLIANSTLGTLDRTPQQIPLDLLVGVRIPVPQPIHRRSGDLPLVASFSELAPPT